MQVQFRYNRTFYFRYIEPKVLEGQTFRDIATALGINYKKISALRKKYNGTRPRSARTLMKVNKRKQERDEKLLKLMQGLENNREQQENINV